MWVPGVGVRCLLTSSHQCTGLSSDLGMGRDFLAAWERAANVPVFMISFFSGL
jgi:hypothetical protein